MVGALALSLVTTVSTVGLARAQEGFGGMSDTLLRELGLPEVEVNASKEGSTAPDSLEAGYYLVTLSADEPLVGYLNIVQYPADLDQATAGEQALLAGNGDMPQAGWTYVGGTNTPDPGETASFAIYLQPGNYHWAVSAYSVEQNGADERMEVLPLSVTEGEAASPAAAEISATVTLEATDDLQYIVTPDPVPAGPWIWKFENAGEHQAHHFVMGGVPEGTTAGDIIGEFNAMMSGTPIAGEPIFAQMTPVGYAALQSGGQTTWVELDMEPGTYAVICFIIDPETGRPHVLDGMATVFTVE